MKYAFLAIFLLSSGAAIAADAIPVIPPKVDYSQEAISNRLTAEINANIQLNAALLAAQDKIKELTDEVAKYKPAEVPKPAEAPKAPDAK